MATFNNIDKGNPKTAVQAIRWKCLDCSGSSHKEVELCRVTSCPLYSYRFGKRSGTAMKLGKQVSADEEEYASNLFNA